MQKSKNFVIPSATRNPPVGWGNVTTRYQPFGGSFTSFRMTVKVGCPRGKAKRKSASQPLISRLHHVAAITSTPLIRHLQSKCHLPPRGKAKRKSASQLFEIYVSRETKLNKNLDKINAACYNVSIQRSTKGGSIWPKLLLFSIRRAAWV